MAIPDPTYDVAKYDESKYEAMENDDSQVTVDQLMTATVVQFCDVMSSADTFTFSQETIAQSLQIFLNPPEKIVAATIEAEEVKPSNSNIRYFLTNDGTTFTEVNLSEELVFTTTDDDLRWKIIFSRTDTVANPKVTTINVKYVIEE